MTALTRDELAPVNSDQFWLITHNGKRRAQPVRVELWQTTTDRVTDLMSGKVPRDRATAFATLIAWDYSNGTRSDVVDVAHRLGGFARDLDDVVGIL